MFDRVNGRTHLTKNHAYKREKQEAESYENYKQSKEKEGEDLLDNLNELEYGTGWDMSRL